MLGVLPAPPIPAGGLLVPPPPPPEPPLLPFWAPSPPFPPPAEVIVVNPEPEIELFEPEVFFAHPSPTVTVIAVPTVTD